MDRPKRKMDRARATALLKDAGELIWRARRRLLIGIPIMLVNRLCGIVIPGTSKYVIDLVIGKHRLDLLWKLTLLAGAASLLGGLTEYLLSQLLGQAAQRSITELRRRIHEHVQRLPVRYFDSTKTGVIVSRVMSDAEGIRNLIGTGLVQMFGGLVTAAISIVILFWLIAKLAIYIVAALLFIATMNTVSTVGGLTTMLAGIVGVIILLVGAREVVAAHMTLGDLVSFIVYLGLVIGPIAQIVAIGTQLSEAF